DWKHHALVLISYVKNLRNRRSLLVPLRGFTLAEVLITLGIIGVVAALTIPTLMQSYQNKQYVSGFQKAWGILTNAFELSEAHNGFANTWDEPTGPYDETYLQKYWLPYFNIIKNCGTASNLGCMPKKTTYLYGTNGNHDDSLAQYKILLSDGMGVNFYLTHHVDDDIVQHIVVDANGSKGPNIYGRDIWWFVFDQKDRKIYPFGIDKTDEQINSNCSKDGPGQYCGIYLVKNGYKMDY
ncbi:prepilin-type N-terminal cleavage/methylation domain-containing protein, partial [bacterium]|nr:prepilin-type N-terminal cleavage/methylation domain-containing protein [bacterium]